jgi:hypothetical protein
MSITNGPASSWWHGSWVYNYIHVCNQFISSLTLWVRIPLRRGVLDTTLCDKVRQLLATDRWFSPGTSVSSINKTDRQFITEILLKVALNTITLTRYEERQYFIVNKRTLIMLYFFILYNRNWHVVYTC